MSADIETWFATQRPSRDVLADLRRVLLDVGLEEAWKWRQPCYTIEGRNVAIVGARKGGCVIGLFGGALLDDPDGQLVSAGPNTRAARNLSFTSTEDVGVREPQIRALLAQAIALGRAGPRPKLETPAEPWPVELLVCFDEDPELKAGFEALTPGRRRGFLLHFNAAKQSSTRTARIQRARPRIVAGKGLHDCICGRSGRMPRCDGTHSKT